MKNGGVLGWVAWVLVIIGGINWALVGLGGNNLNLVAIFFGDSLIARLIYIIIGLGALYLVYLKIQAKKTET